LKNARASARHAWYASSSLRCVGVSYHEEIVLAVDRCRVDWDVVDIKDLPEFHLLIFDQLVLDADFDLRWLLLDTQFAVLVRGCCLLARTQRRHGSWPAEGSADLICGYRCVDPNGGIESGLGSKASAHAVLTHVPAAFVEAAGADENCPRAPSKAGAAYVAKRGTGESSVVSDVNGAGALKAKRLKHAGGIVDG